MKIPPRRLRFFNKTTATVLSISLAFSNSVTYASPSSSDPIQDQSAAIPSIFIPEALGKIEESYQASCPKPQASSQNLQPEACNLKRIIYIQDAHDSLEAQENIAKLIHYFVEHYGVTTVFEEGYEGPVPTDEYFGFIKDTAIKEKVSYFLMDKLRIGGAEYAHINRFHRLSSPNDSIGDPQVGPRLKHSGATKNVDFKLIGADNIKLHLENIEWYRKSAQHKAETDKDLTALSTEITKLADQYFPKEFKEWIKLKKRFDKKQLSLLDYLKRTMTLVPSLRGAKQRSNPGSEIASATAWPRNDIRGYPAIHLLLQAENTSDKSVIEQVKQIDPKTLFEEIDRLENDFAESFLTGERDQQIFHYHKSLALLKRLNDIRLTPPEYEAVKGHLQNLVTQALAQFIAQHTKKSIVLSKRWEKNIQAAIRFYEIAQGRDKAIEKTLDQFVGAGLRPPAGEAGARPSSGQPQGVAPTRDSQIAILVFGGFHKERIKEILQKQGYSYVVVSPKITEIDPRHQGYYKQLMGVGHLPFEVPFLPEDDAYQTLLEDEFDFEIVLAAKGQKRLILQEPSIFCKKYA